MFRWNINHQRDLGLTETGSLWLYDEEAARMAHIKSAMSIVKLVLLCPRKNLYQPTRKLGGSWS